MVRKHWPLLLLAGALALLQLWACTLELEELLQHLAIDDTFLYLQIARNVARGQGATFDGIHPTNGFQPLWLAATVPLGLVFHEPGAFFRASLVLCALLNLATACLLYRLGFRLGGRWTAITALVGWTWLLVNWKPFLSAMETSLYLLVFVWFLDLLLRERPNPWMVSLAGGLMILCRVDAVIFVFAGLVVLRPWRRKVLTAALVPLLLVTAPYFGWNMLVFESPMPVSGSVKALYHQQELGDSYLGPGHLERTLRVDLPRAVTRIIREMAAPLRFVLHRKAGFHIGWVFLLSLCALALAGRFKTPLLIVAAAGLFHLLLLSALIGRFSVLAWYFAPLMLLIIIGAAVAATRIDRLLPRRGAYIGGVLLGVVWLVCLAAGAAQLAEPVEKQDLYQRRHRIARWADERLPPDTIIGAWNAGQLAFFTDLTVINLDGLVNDRRYLHRLRKGLPVIRYIDNEQIRFLIDYNAPDLSMPEGREWDRERYFRGDVPWRRLRAVHQLPAAGGPHAVKVLHVLPPSHRRAAGDPQPSKTGPGGRSPNAVMPGSGGQTPLNLDVPGRWHRGPLISGKDEGRTTEHQRAIEELEAIGYVSGSREFTGPSGVVTHDPANAWQGFNLYTSGHGPEAILMDMDGKVLHRWLRAFRDVWPAGEISTLESSETEAQDRSRSADTISKKRRKKKEEGGMAPGGDVQYWRRVHLYPNGDLLAIFEGSGLIKLDRDSSLIWASPCRAHHDLEVMENGDIYLLTRKARINPLVNRRDPVLEDFITRLDSEGRVKSRISVLDCFENSPRYRYIWRMAAAGHGDIFHTNTLSLLDGSHAETHRGFARGNILISMKELDTIAVVNPRKERVVWAAQGRFKGQHDPAVLENGNLLLFDNYGIPGRSTIREYDIPSWEPLWLYEGAPGSPFYSQTCGTCQRLPNGNTLITESDGGRAFEVTRDGTVVWEFFNPHRAGDRDQYIATLFEVLRLPPDFPVDTFLTAAP